MSDLYKLLELAESSLSDYHAGAEYGEYDNYILQAIRKALSEKSAPVAQCRDDGRCQYAIDHGAEGLAACPKEKCAMPPAPVAHPLTDEQIDAIFRKTTHWIGASPKDGLFIKFARAVIEASAPAPVAQSCCDHASDCAVHNAPALPVGPCDCGVTTAPVLTPAQAHAGELFRSLGDCLKHLSWDNDEGREVWNAGNAVWCKVKREAETTGQEDNNGKVPRV